MTRLLLPVLGGFSCMCVTAGIGFFVAFSTDAATPPTTVATVVLLTFYGAMLAGLTTLYVAG